MGNGAASGGRDERQRAVDRERAEQATSVLARLRIIVAPLAADFAETAGRYSSLPLWRVRISYNYDTTPDGYARHGKATVTIHPDGAFEVDSPTASHGSGDVYPDVVRASIAKALQAITGEV